MVECVLFDIYCSQSIVHNKTNTLHCILKLSSTILSPIDTFFCFFGKKCKLYNFYSIYSIIKYIFSYFDVSRFSVRLIIDVSLKKKIPETIVE